jgi:hypothetical protein
VNKGYIFAIVIFCFFLISTSINYSFGDEVSTRTPAFDHADLTDQEERNAQKTPHTDSFTWKKGETMIPYTVDEKWNFFNNNLMDKQFSRTWNHTMEDHELQKFNGTMHNWWTGLTLNRVGEIDTVSGTYEMDFFYWIQIFEDDDPANFKNIEPNVDFINAVEYEIGIAKGIIQKPHYYEAEISGIFYKDMDFQKFPFEKLKLNIIIEPWINDTSYSSENDSIQFHVWPYRALEENIPSPGYEIVGYTVKVDDHSYSEGDTFSRYEATFEIQREYIGSILKFITPVFLMSGLAMLALVFPSEEFMTKIELNAIFLLGILFFVQVVSEEIPSTESMTVFDHFVILSYMFIVVTIGIPAAKWVKRTKYEKDKEKLEDDEIDDKRDTDLLYYRLNDVNLQLTLQSIKLLDRDQDKKEEINRKIKELETERLLIKGKMDEKKNENYQKILEKYKEINALTKDGLEKSYKKCNIIACIIIGGLAIGYGSYIGSILYS